MDAKTKHKILKVLPLIVITIALFVGGIVILLLTFLPKNDDIKQENYDFFRGGVYFDYANNRPEDRKTLSLISNSDGSLQVHSEYFVVTVVGDKPYREEYYISNFTLNGKEITIYFDEKLFAPVHGVFSDDWTSITFSDEFPLALGERGWRFDIREKA